MTKYIKTTATEFEQFDEAEWDRKYKSCQHPEDWQQLAGRLNIDRHMGQFIIQSREGDMRLHDGDWIATGARGEHWPVADEIFKQTYTKLPKVPSFVANHIGFSKHINQGFNSSVLTMVQDIYDWYDKNGELYARAWLDGYEIDNKS